MHTAGSILDLMTRNWWVFALRGAFAVMFGIAALVWPGLTLLVLVTLYGAFAIVDGVTAAVGAFRGGRGVRWSLLAWGLLGVGAGIIAFVWPDITALALVFLIAAWALATGAIQVAAAIRLRKEIQGEWVLALAGVASILFGVLLAIFPGAGALSLTWLIGAYAIVFGVTLVTLGLRLRRWRATV